MPRSPILTLQPALERDHGESRYRAEGVDQMPSGLRDQARATRARALAQLDE